MESETAPEEACRPLRRDAARNRELILEMAAKVFAEQGLDASYEEIARRAGTGVGTVYRRFPERNALIEALFESRIQEILAIAEQASQEPNAWDALVMFLERTVERQAVDRGLQEIMNGMLDTDEYRVIGRERLGSILDDMVVRAQASGALRPDVVASDIGVQLMLVSTLTTTQRPDLWRRYLALAVDGLRARPDLAPLQQGPPDDDDIQTMMCSVHGRPR